MPDEASPTRVLLFDIPRLMSDLVRAVVDETPDIELVGEATDVAALTSAINDTGPDVLILSASEFELPATATDAFDNRPELKILVLTGDGEPSFLWELAPWRVSLGQLSPARLRAALSEPRTCTWH
ncbi:MAG: hypothetical protein ABW195_04680 [Ilumatobacteraceae bacterium]